MLTHYLRNTAILGLLGWLLASMPLATPLAAIEPWGDTASVAQTPAVRLTGLPELAQILPRLDNHRVVFVGEFHTHLEDHRIQLEVIRYLATRDRPLAIGVEWFQQPFQEALDRYLAGAIDARELLRSSEYYQRWGYDFRLYAPILRFARTHGIPVIALNVPAELTQAAAKRDLDQLAPELRKWVPDTIDRTNTAYRDRLERVYRAHSGHGKVAFEHFYTAQLLWDEGMAERAARYLEAHPNTRMVILAGSGHLAYGSGIPSRLRRRTGLEGVILLPGWNKPLKAGLADYLLLPEAQKLPESGRLGVEVVAKAGHVIVHGFTDYSSARAMGVKIKDVLLAINNQPVQTISDVRVALWNHPPGDVMRLRIRRTVPPGEPRTITFDIPLH